MVTTASNMQINFLHARFVFSVLLPYPELNKEEKIKRKSP